ncbi:hypothetical protein FH609_011820 [Streptomyces sp. 3MP-14]|uniref:Uncharacterized protein n=1 Tax=Streptomyces mimosae TaxID=2586635 RepID=A0A5N6AEJ7_9ACTN|nr:MULTISPECIES: hypothetical protein [Streptomyces]KAB8167081.1 hypothetical protein FH607_009270 [Streptomyces mimosae]KAB8177022.1 hypothetical protein FH609_011820 [Streptomyces sp. 3MP-14]
MNSTFEDRLLDELKRHHSVAVAERRMAVARRRRLITPARTGLGLVTAAAATAVFVVLPGGGGAPAYAVEQEADGGVVVHISDWPHGEEAVAEFSALLEEAGVETLYNPPEGYLCQPRDEPSAGEPGADESGMTFSESGEDDGERSFEEETEPGERRPAEVPDGASTADGVEVNGHVSFLGGATPIGPEVAQSIATAGDSTDPLLDPEALADPAATEGGYTYHLTRGDTVILSDRDGAESIAFVEGQCQPVAG